MSWADRGAIGQCRARYQIVRLTLEAFLQMKLGWLLPLVLLLLVLVSVMATVSALGPLAPFVYPLF